jgi:hypothetical protein
VELVLGGLAKPSMLIDIHDGRLLVVRMIVRMSLTHAAASSAEPQAIHPDAPDGKYPGH